MAQSKRERNQEIRRLASEGYTHKEIAPFYGISYQRVGHILNTVSVDDEEDLARLDAHHDLIIKLALEEVRADTLAAEFRVPHRVMGQWLRDHRQEIYRRHWIRHKPDGRRRF